MDTVTLMRSAIRGLFKVADRVLEGRLRGLITSGDDYANSAKPQSIGTTRRPGRS